MQAVGFIETLRVKCNRPGPFIVVVPLSTIRHWQKEFDERSRANTVVLHGTTEDRDAFVGSEFTGMDSSFVVSVYLFVCLCICLSMCISGCVSERVT